MNVIGAWILIVVIPIVTVAVIALYIWDFTAEERYVRRREKSWYRTW